MAEAKGLPTIEKDPAEAGKLIICNPVFKLPVALNTVCDVMAPKF